MSSFQTLPAASCFPISLISEQPFKTNQNTQMVVDVAGLLCERSFIKIPFFLLHQHISFKSVCDKQVRCEKLPLNH